MTLQGKTIVITGAVSGIGAEVARLARFAGARVIGIDRNDPTLTLDGFVKADLGDAEAPSTRPCAQLPERIDALCNIAGVPGTAPVELVARVNYLGLRHLTSSVLPRMPARRLDRQHRVDPRRRMAAAAGAAQGAGRDAKLRGRRRNGCATTRCRRRPATSTSRKR